MNGPAFVNFVVEILLLIGIGLALTYGIDRIVKDEFFRKMARLVIGIGIAVCFLLAISAAFFGGPGLRTSPGALIELAIGVIVIVAVVEIAGWFLASWKDPPIGLDKINYVISVIVVIVLLGIAGKALFYGGWGVINLGGPGAPLFPLR